MREILHRKWPKAGYIAYFQAYTNTYAPLDQLKALYEQALELDGVVGLSHCHQARLPARQNRRLPARLGQADLSHD